MLFTVLKHVHRISPEKWVGSVWIDDRPEIEIRNRTVGQVELPFFDVVRLHRFDHFEQFGGRLFTETLQKVTAIELMLATAHLDRQHLGLVARKMVERKRWEYAASRQNDTMKKT